MKILLSNDDGCQAPGLVCLRDHLRLQHEVAVVAPDRNRSGASNSLTLMNPLRVQTHADGTVCVDGTPTDCVHLALNGLIALKPDLVVSGINSGANLGDDTLYSGTVAAAMEGRHLGYAAIAVSNVSFEPQRDLTDEASAVEYRGLQPRLVRGSEANIKVTYPEDPQLAGFWREQQERRR